MNGFRRCKQSMKYDDDNFYVHIHEVNTSKLKLHDGPVYNLLISIITDDKEAMDLTVEALAQWFKERGLS